MVVVDIGYSMGEPMLAGVQKSQSPLSMARNLTEALMSTLSGFDCINVIVYNSSDAILLAPTPVSAFILIQPYCHTDERFNLRKMNFSRTIHADMKCQAMCF